MDEMVAAVKTCLNKYADFKGRASRPEFWWFALAWVILLALTAMVSRYLYGIAVLALLLPGLAVGTRRLHDTGKTGWWQLVGLIPLIGSLAIIYLMAQPGQSSANTFGDPPVTPAAPTPPMAPGQQ